MNRGAGSVIGGRSVVRLVVVSLALIGPPSYLWLPSPREVEGYRAVLSRQQLGLQHRSDLVGLWLQSLSPGLEQSMNRCRPDDGILRLRQPGWIEEERPCLGPAKATMERNQLLEGASLIEMRVVKAPHHDVRDVRKPVGTAQMVRGVRGECGQWIVPLNAPVQQELSAAGSKHNRPMF